MTIIKTILSIIAVCLFIGNKYVCDLFYSENDLVQWWTLRLNLYAVLMGLLFIIANMEGKSKFLSLVLSVGIGFCISDIIDRLYFDINTFTYNDIFMIAITIAASYYTSHVRKGK